ncbi:uncharacterized protein Z518_03917 [Rhinocladiella mackenziei CBS 650.93]|uniref:Xylanolytic transcriptional activator regulatory domain-containing protein n=1 Tax=Rhinocladiella mackenziei CBS 650.93 TaxID=1442369 RepID=A0A0D2H6C9_9EURO|nr:uncharacterized protein Z518_03917 [Rhinocladiella mackenziei CBS 650.93]KIX05943.1 hypothetical protein Z518_03917 [Rhinocladiella mackenziei CBS 650.93]
MSRLQRDLALLPEDQGKHRREVAQDPFHARVDSDFSHQPPVDKCSITYLGETFPLNMITGNQSTENKEFLHRTGPAVQKIESKISTQSRGHPTHIQPEEITSLSSRGMFEYPSERLMEEFKLVFLELIYPLYPVVNRDKIVQQLRTKTVPWILLHSFCFIVSTYCPVSVLVKAQFSSRYAARVHYYTKAKALFDCGYEVDKITTLRSVFFLSFWNSSPSDYWNFSSWTSTAVNVAETLGIHRSIAGAKMNAQDRSLRRRLWWILVIRDSSFATVLGRPFRINTDSSDARPLAMEDFQHEIESSDFESVSLGHEFALYQIHLSKLCLISRQILTTRNQSTAQTLQGTVPDYNVILKAWRKKLPPELDWVVDHPGTNIFSWSLSIVFDHNVILANAEQFSSGIGKQPCLSRHGAGCVCDRVCRGIDSAARRILTQACKIMRMSAQFSVLHEIFPGLFAAEAVFLSQAKSHQPGRTLLGSLSLTTCQLIWKSAEEVWKPARWIMDLFDALISDMPLGDLCCFETVENTDHCPALTDQSACQIPRNVENDSWQNQSTLPEPSALEISSDGVQFSEPEDAYLFPCSPQPETIDTTPFSDMCFT